jgi:biopolymer transport protein ExbB
MDEKITSIEVGMSSIKIIASISPLIGLLGTVVGVLGAFEAVAATGLGDPSSFASGISLALVTTVMGLIIAIPHYVAYNYFNRTIDIIDAKFSKELDILIVKDKQDA